MYPDLWAFLAVYALVVGLLMIGMFLGQLQLLGLWEEAGESWSGFTMALSRTRARAREGLWRVFLRLRRQVMPRRATGNSWRTKPYGEVES